MLNQAPNHWTFDSLRRATNGQSQCSPDGELWYPARPLGFYSIGNRFRLAWLVFTGRADALTWPGDQ